MTLDVQAVSCASGREALQLAIDGGGGTREITSLLVQEAEESTSSDSYDHHTALEIAASAGCVDAVERLLEAGADPNAPVSFGGTSALEAAAAAGQLVTVQLLLKKGAHPNHCGKFGDTTPLIAATKAGHTEIAKVLLHAGADVSISKDWDKVSAIKSAAETSNIILLELFLATVTDVVEGFDPAELQVAIAQGRQKDSQQLIKTAEFLERTREHIETALVSVGRTGNMLILQRLLDAGAYANAHTAIAAAAGWGHLEAMNKLLQVALDQNNLPGDSITDALQCAVDAGNVAMIEPLIKAGADATRIDIRGASRKRYLAALISVLRSGASANTASSYYSPYGSGTALQLAAKHGHQEVVELLLASGANVNAPAGEHGGTALQLAVAGEHMTVIKRLIDAGADINAPSSSRFTDTALQAATRTGNTAIFELLLATGAVVDTADCSYHSWNNTSLSIAAETNQPKLVARLLSLMSLDDARQTAAAALQKAVENHHTDIVRQLLRVHPDVNFQDSHRPTMLQEAAENGDLDILKMLLAKKADVNLDPTRGRRKTALQAVSEDGCLDAVQLLLTAGAEVNVTGSTAPPLLLAIRNGHLQVAEHLLAAGADIHATAYRGQTMQQAAEDSGDADMKEWVRAALESRPEPQEEQPPGRGTGPLCETCRTASLPDLCRGEKGHLYTLHPSLIALRTSAVMGCPFCCFIWKTLGIRSIPLPQPSPVRFYLQTYEPGVMTCQVEEPFPKNVERPERLMIHFHFAIEPFRGETSI